MEKYDITDYLKDDKELQKAVIEEFLKEIAELKAYKDVNEDFKTAWEELKAENERLKKEIRNNKSAYQVELGTYNMECGNLLEENKNLTEENERLKEEARTEKIYSSQIEELEESLNHLKQENEKIIVGYIKLSERYKQTLQEIKEIAEDAYENDSEYQASGVYNEILQKITKAEEE